MPKTVIICQYLHFTFYSKSRAVCHLQAQRVAGYRNSVAIRTLFQMYILVYLATVWTDLTI